MVEAQPSAPPAAVVPAAVPAEAPPAEEHSESWYEALDVSAFVDGYASFNGNRPKPQDGRNAFRAFDRTNGFALAWAGLNVAYSSDRVGATVDFRLGPSASVLAGDDAKHGLEFVKQAYGTYRPFGTNGALTLDLGKFDGIYGVENADSQRNATYTRGLLYALAEPHFFTGLRATYAFTDALSASLVLANGWDRSVDDNFGKTLGLQLAYSAPRGDGSGNLVTARLGYVVGPEQVDFYACPPGATFESSPTPRCVAEGASAPTRIIDRGEANGTGLRHFVNAVVIVEPNDDLAVSLDGVYGHETQLVQLVYSPKSSTVDWFGASLTGRYRFDDVWGAALRGEYLRDSNAALCGALCQAAFIRNLDLLGVTGTVEAAPSDHLLLRLDARVDHASGDPTGDVFPVLADSVPTQWTLTLGVVASAD